MKDSNALRKVDLSIEFCGLEFQNPFLLASGPATARREAIERAFDAGWGGAVTKLTGLKTRPSPHPYIAALTFEGKKIGLENVDSIIFHAEDLFPVIKGLKKKYPDKILIANITGNTDASSWQKVAKKMQDAGADMLELNLSCPLTEEERAVGATIGQDPKLTREIVKWVKEVTHIPVMVKLTSNVTDITSIARAAEEGGADALSAINTVLSFVGIDLKKMEPRISVGGMSAFGGYSGPAIKPIALRCVAQAAKSTKLPISGVGGISTWEDAVEFFMAGASTVQLCTAVMFKGHRIIDRLKDGVSDYLREKGFDSIKDIVGRVLPKLTSIEKLDFIYRVIPQVDISECTKCGLCHLACRDAGYEAIELDEEKLPIVNEERCGSCGLCSQVCPARAISLEPRR
ncbi:MAG: NAD-dependent dihydropyrimidine dehydrogenase subunit PreA [Actinomycetota bacterium]|nr:NAD-dependent dihydropyrimidine dehydrogenase subunit PreA [Actinomycetota bacterium]